MANIEYPDIGLDKEMNKNCQCKSVNIFLSIIFSICFGGSKSLIETVLLSTHCICFCREIDLRVSVRVRFLRF